MKGRFWRYSYRSWRPYWWHWMLPFFGGDEYGRCTIVQHVPPFGFLVWAYRTCRCEDCDEIRRETSEMEAWDGATTR